MLPIKTLLHPTNFSEASEHARRIAEGLARDYHSRLILLHSVEPPVITNEIATDTALTEDEREQWLERLKAMADAASSLNVETCLVEGFAAAEINRVAAEQGCDLIVLGSHGRSGLSRVLMGSVAEEVARKAPCPVLIVRERHEIPHPAPAQTHASAH